MNITLYKSKSSMNTVDKGGANLTPLLTVSGNFKNAQSILTPIVIIDTIDSLLLVDDNGQVVLDDYKRPLLTSRDASKEIIKANYCYIDELQRYYFISDIQVVNNDLIQLYLKEDVLYTYANQIKEHTAYISRNEFTNTPLIEDRNEQLFYDKEVSYKDTIEITTGEAVNFSFDVSQLGPNNIIFSAISDTYDYTGKLVDTPKNLPSFNYINEFYTTLYGIDRPLLIPFWAGQAIAQDILAKDTEKTFIKNFLICPFDVTSQQDTSKNLEIFLGKTNISKFPKPGTSGENVVEIGTVHPMKSLTSDYLVVADFTIPDATSYLDYEPYCQYEIFVPFYGYVTLPTNKVRGQRILLYYALDWQKGNGMAFISIINGTENKIIWNGQVDPFIHVDLSTTNAYENKVAQNGVVTSTVLGTLSSVISLVGGLASGNPLGAIAGVMGLGKTISSTIQSSQGIIDRANVGFTDGMLSQYSNTKPFLRITKMKTTNTINKENYAHLFGLPLYKSYKLKDLRGYTIISEINLDDLDTAKSSELTELYSLLKGGVYL